MGVHNNVVLNWRIELFFWDSRFSFSSDLSIIICIVFFFVSSVSAIHLRKKSANKYFKEWYRLWKLKNISKLTAHLSYGLRDLIHSGRKFQFFNFFGSQVGFLFCITLIITISRMLIVGTMTPIYNTEFGANDSPIT